MKKPQQNRLKRSARIETAISFRAVRQLTRLGPEVRLTEEKKHRSKSARLKIQPTSRFGIVKNQVAGGILVEDQRDKGSFQVPDACSN